MSLSLPLTLLFCLPFCFCIKELYPFGAHDLRLAQDDESSSQEIQLSVPIVFYETAYRSLFVNTNGILSFLTEVPNFFNAQFPLTYPLISPLYSDVDTRGSGTVYYRESKEVELLEKTTQLIRRHFTKALHFRPQSIFIVTWSDVGHYNRKSNAKNTFQTVIASDGANSFVLFLYPENGIQWIRGDGKVLNLPDARAQAGFMSGDGRTYILPASGSDQVQRYDKMSNVRRPGMWMFQVGNVGNGNVELPDLMNDAPVLNTCADNDNPCPPSAKCIDYRGGFCCQCLEGSFGNGRECIENGKTMRLNGKITGVLNRITLDNVNLYTYVETKDGKTFTGISRVPPNLGPDMQSLFTVGTIVGWIFAFQKPGHQNGFSLTGGRFNRTTDIEFTQSGDHVHVVERFLGPDVFGYVAVNIEIRGTLPSIPFGSKVILDDFADVFTRESNNVLRSEATRTLKFEQSPTEVPMKIEQVVAFVEDCAVLPENDKRQTFRTESARNFIAYDNREHVVRFSAVHTVGALEADPCVRGRAECGAHSVCMPDGNDFKCVCEHGYESRGVTEQLTCTDIDECATNRHNCDPQASCLNSPGKYECRCKSGYVGDGFRCQRQSICEDLRCHSYAVCVMSGGVPRCQCKEGYKGDGYSCRNTGESDCGGVRCDENAECMEDESGLHCHCKPGYMGPGTYCIEEFDSCENCHIYAECLYDKDTDSRYCVCKSGYFGDGFTCVLQGCDVTKDCDPNAQCLYNTTATKHECQCLPGFVGDGRVCKKIGGDSTCPILCSPQADCLLDVDGNTYRCHCREGFEGDGEQCRVKSHCRSHDECAENSHCAYDRSARMYKCECNPGFERVGNECKPAAEQSCNVVNNCHRDATCVYEELNHQYKCTCREGFSGNGFQCRAMDQCRSHEECGLNSHCAYNQSLGKYKCTCNPGHHIIGGECKSISEKDCRVVKDCDVNADCLVNVVTKMYECKCRPGYSGNGNSCTKLSRTCVEDLDLCDRNARCLYSNGLYSCQCLPNFIGDGMHCIPQVPQTSNEFLIFAQGMSLLQMPLKPTPEDKGKLILTKSHHLPVGIDVDCTEGYVYWTDVFNHAIHKAPYNGSLNEKILADKTESPEGISIDWISRNIYWTDSKLDSIQVATLDGRYVKTVISDDLVDPRGIVVHPGIGKLYWSDWNRESPKIESAALDGTDRRTLVNTDLGLPNMLAIDFHSNDLCWTDAGLKRIECHGLHNSNRRVVFTPAPYPFDLTVAKNYIFWTDWQLKYISKVDKNGGEVERFELPLGGNGKAYGIVTVPQQCPRMTNACASKNGGCDFLCLPNGRGGRTCDCPDPPHEGHDECIK